MKNELVKYLVCPICKSNLILEAEDKNESITQKGILYCQICNRIFPINSGIPRFNCTEIIDHRQQQTVEVFSTQWQKFGKVTIDERAFSISREWMFSRYGWSSENEFIRYLKDKPMILDAGSASGRYADYLAKCSMQKVIGAEIGAGIEVAQANFGNNPQLHFVQASITNLPFTEEIFDFILCDGVLHHTTSPRENFVKLTKLLKEGGEIAIYLYHIGNPLREMTDSCFIEALSCKSMEENLLISKEMTELAAEIYDSGATIHFPKRLERLQIDSGMQSLYEFLLYKVIKLYWDPNVSFEKNHSTNFGWFAPINAFRYTGEEIEKWFKMEKLEIIHRDISQRGISIRARKSRIANSK